MKTDPGPEELKEDQELDSEKGGLVEIIEIAFTYCLCFVPNLVFSLVVGTFLWIKTASFWWGICAFAFSFIMLFVPSQQFAHHLVCYFFNRYGVIRLQLLLL